MIAAHAGTCSLAIAMAVAVTAASPASGQSSAESEVRAAVELYNDAFVGKDLPALKALLAEDIVLYV